MVSAMSADEMQDMRDRVQDMFWHAYSNYMEHAFPEDELRPLSCSGMKTWGNYSLTLIDSLDSLLVMGQEAEFLRSVKWVVDNVSFDVDVGVSVFETNIRVVGGLLSAHQMLLHAPVIQRPVHVVQHEEDSTETRYDVEMLANQVLQQVIDLTDRLMPAFDTNTGIPFGYVNLRNGVLKNETTITSVAGGGTHLLEFTLLSLLTGDKRYAEAAHKAAVSFFHYRNSQTGLLGNHINIENGQWRFREATIGSNVDSYFEYLVKTYSLFGRDEYWHMFTTLYTSVIEHNHRFPPWYIDVDMVTTAQTWTLFNSLQAFWPGLQAQLGGITLKDRQHQISGSKNRTSDTDLHMARDTLLAFHSVWRRFGAVPEGFNFMTNAVQPRQKLYPLRPEMIESAYFLFLRTRDPLYLHIGRDIVHSIDTIMRVPCGFATVRDVETRELGDRMESFFLAETLKYALLLFDEDHWVNRGHYVFNTEAHIIPARVEYLTEGMKLKYDDERSAQWSNMKEEDKMCKLSDWYDNVGLCELRWSWS